MMPYFPQPTRAGLRIQALEWPGSCARPDTLSPQPPAVAAGSEGLFGRGRLINHHWARRDVVLFFSRGPTRHSEGRAASFATENLHFWWGLSRDAQPSFAS